MNELVLYAVWDAERRRYYIDTAERTEWPRPEDCAMICTIDREDRELMIDWAVKLAKRHVPLPVIRKEAVEVNGHGVC